MLLFACVNPWIVSIGYLFQVPLKTASLEDLMERFCEVRDECKTKKNVSLPELGGGFTLARIFLRPFLLKEKVSSMVTTAERVGKVARIGVWGGGFG